MGSDEDVEELLEELRYAELPRAHPEWIHQQYWWTLLVVGFIAGYNVEWQLLHPVMLTLYAIAGGGLAIPYVLNIRSLNAVERVFDRVDSGSAPAVDQGSEEERPSLEP